LPMTSVHMIELCRSRSVRLVARNSPPDRGRFQSIALLTTRLEADLFQ
jgi:hypothetical protein